MQLLFLLLFLIDLLSRSQALALPAPPAVRPQDVVPGPSGAGPWQPVPGSTAADLVARLEATRLALEIDRDHRAAVSALAAIHRAALAASPFEDDLEVWVRLVQARVDLHLQLGEADEAARVLEELLQPDGGRLDEETARRARALAPRLVARAEIEALRRQVAALQADPGGAGREIADAVALALQSADARVLQDLGSRAVPALVALIAPGRSDAPAPAQDPLTWLVRLDPVLAAEVMGRLLAQDALLRRDRVVNALAGAGLVKAEESWYHVAGRSPRFVRQGWLEVLTALVGDGDLYRTVDHDSGRALGRQLVAPFLERDALPPEWVAPLAAVLLDLDEERRAELYRYLRPAEQWRSGSGGLDRLLERRPSHRPLLERLLVAGDDATRRLASQALSAWPADATLLTRWDDEDPAVRLAVVRCLQRQVVFEVQRPGPGQQTTVESEVQPSYGTREREVLARLAGDPDAEVRLMVARILEDGIGAPLDPEVLLGLARDPDGRVRVLMASLDIDDGTVLGQVLETLAVDEDPVVRSAVGARLGAREVPADVAARLVAALAVDADPLVRQDAARALGRRALPVDPAVVRVLAADADPLVRASLARLESQDQELLREVLLRLADSGDERVLAGLDGRLADELAGGAWLEHADMVLELLEQRALGPRRGAWADSSRSWRKVLATVPGQLAMTRWALRTDADWLWRELLSGRVGTEQAEAWSQLGAEELAALLGRLATRDPDALERFVVGGALQPVEAHVGAARAVAGDPGQPRLLRFMLCWFLAHAAPDATVELLMPLGQLAAASEPPLSGEERNWLHQLARTLPGERLNGLLLALLAPGAPLFQELAFEDLASAYDPRAPGGEQVTVALLERRLGDGRGPHSRSLARAVKALGHFPGLVEAGLLERLAREGSYRADAVEAMGRLRDPAFLPVLEECLAEDPDVAPQLVEAAQAAVVSFMSDDAAAILLRVAGQVRSKAWRESLMEGVASIRQYQGALLDWERRLATLQTRDDAIAGLLVLLEDDDPVLRAEAARGLATLGAVDQLPRLIRLLQDDEARVRDAARSALDTLHAAGAR